MAGCAEFDLGSRQGVSSGLEAARQCSECDFVMQFGHFAASRADQKQPCLGMTVVVAGNEVVDPADPVRKPMLDQEVESTINCRRGGRRADGLDLLQQVISLQAARLKSQQGQHLTSNRGQACATGFAQGGRLIEKTGFVQRVKGRGF